MVRNGPAMNLATPAGIFPDDRIGVADIAEQSGVVADLSAGTAALQHQAALRGCVPIGARQLADLGCRFWSCSHVVILCA